MFTDIVGYSAIMSEDESKALEVLNRNRTIQKSLIKKFQGVWLKEIGDGVLVSFTTVSDAVFCAAAIQQACENEPDLKLRIGIHQGEVVFENNDVFGEGVNIASRIEALAPPGAIYVSAAVYHNISNRKEIEAVFIEEASLKNISHPVKLYQVNIQDKQYLSKLLDAVKDTSQLQKQWRRPLVAIVGILILVGASIWWILNPGAASSDDSFRNKKSISDPTANKDVLTLPPGPRIAVLPFENLSNNPDQEYFTDGLTEDIITALSGTDLFVLASGTSFRFKTDSMDILDIGEELGVGYILKGSVRRDLNTIRVSAQLLDVTTGGQVWGTSYDRDLTTLDIFALQDDITVRVVGTIADASGIISRVNQEELQRKHPSELNAYECVLRSYQYVESHNQEDHLQARECLENALKMDSTYVDGMAHLAYLYREEYQHGFNQRPNALNRAAELAQKAINLDPMNQNAYYALALAYFGKKEVNDFFIASEHAIALNPNNSQIIGGMGVHVALAGNWQKGISLLEKSMVLNPYSSLKPWLYFARASDDCLKKDFSKALIEINQVQLSDLPLFDIIRLSILMEVDQEEKAQTKLKEVLSRNPDFIQNAREELEKYYLVNPDLIDLFIKNLTKISEKIY